MVMLIALLLCHHTQGKANLGYYRNMLRQTAGTVLVQAVAMLLSIVLKNALRVDCGEDLHSVAVKVVWTISSMSVPLPLRLCNQVFSQM